MSALFERIRQVLFDCHEREEICGVHYEPATFEHGFIREIDGDSFRLERIDRHGQNWGSFVGTLDKVMRVQFGTQYIQAVRMLLERDKLSGNQSKGAPESLEMEKLLAFVTSKNILVGLHIEDGSVMFGYVRAYSDDHIEFEEINFLGYEDGRRVFPVMRLTYGGPDEESRKFLNRVRLGL